MGGAETVIVAFGELRSWLERALAQLGTRSEKKRKAVESLLRATRETQTYINDQDKFPPKERRIKERELSFLWETAALAFFEINNGDMAPILQLKSESWAAPDKWPEAKVEQFGITIDRISEKARRILAG